MCFFSFRFRPLPSPLPPCHFWDGNSDLFCTQLVYPSSSSGISTIQHAHRLISTGTSRAWGTVGGMCCGVGFALWLVPLLALSLGGAVARQRWLEPHWEGLMCAGFGWLTSVTNGGGCRRFMDSKSRSFRWGTPTYRAPQKGPPMPMSLGYVANRLMLVSAMWVERHLDSGWQLFAVAH